MTDEAAPAPRVSVVVPVFDPGPYIEPAIASILGQTIPAGQMEAIFVDDGSTDGTPARLDRLAAEHPDIIRVIHIEPSGAPGRPRNVGIDAARGDYIQFLDADDELALDALERLVAMADRNRSDVVIAKFASGSVPRSGRLFSKNVEATSVVEMPGLADSSLGPTKLFRRALIDRHEIRFPEGWRLMEDQAFTLRAYFRADIVSILADHTCYFFHRRADGRGLTTESIDPDAHFRNLRTLVDLVEGETEPGSDLRDRILRRILRVEVMSKVGEASYPDLDEAERARFFDAARSFLAEIDPETIARLAALDRIRCELLLTGKPVELLGLARRTRDLGLSAVVESAEWRNGVYEARVRASFEFTDPERPLVVSHRAGRWYLDAGLADEWLGHPLDVTDDLERFRLEIGLRAPGTAEEWRMKATIAPVPWAAGEASDQTPQDLPAVPVSVHATVRVDPQCAGPGAEPIVDGTWELMVRLSTFGVGRIERAVASGDARGPGRVDLCPALVGDPGRVVVPVNGTESLQLEVAPSSALFAAALPMQDVRVMGDGKRLELLLPMHAGPEAGPAQVTLVVRASDGGGLLDGALRPWREHVVLDIPSTGVRGVPDGTYPVLLRLDGGDDATDGQLGGARISERSGLRMQGVARLGSVARLRLVGASMVDHTRTSVRGRLRGIRRRLPGAKRKR